MIDSRDNNAFVVSMEHILKNGLRDCIDNVYWIFIGLAQATGTPGLRWVSEKVYPAYGIEFKAAKDQIKTLGKIALEDEQSLLWQARGHWEHSPKSFKQFYYRSKCADLSKVLFFHVPGKPSVKTEAEKLLFPLDSAAILCVVNGVSDSKVNAIVVVCFREAHIKDVGNRFVLLRLQMNMLATEYGARLETWTKLARPTNCYEAMWNLLTLFGPELPAIPFASGPPLHEFLHFEKALNETKHAGLRDFRKACVSIAQTLSLDISVVWDLLKPLYRTKESVIGSDLAFAKLWGPALTRHIVSLESKKALVVSQFCQLLGINKDEFDLAPGGTQVKVYAPLDLQFRFFAPLADLVRKTQQDKMSKPLDENLCYRLTHSLQRVGCLEYTEVARKENKPFNPTALSYRSQELCDKTTGKPTCKREVASYEFDILCPYKYGGDLFEMALDHRLSGVPATQDEKEKGFPVSYLNRVVFCAPNEKVRKGEIFLQFSESVRNQIGYERGIPMARVAEIHSSWGNTPVAGIRIAWNSIHHLGPDES